MLEDLRVENLLLIEEAQLRFAPGLNVLTGETGAGKTVLAHALDLLLGGRPRQGIVRPGAQEAYVEGSFLAPAAALSGLAEGSVLEGLREQEGAADQVAVVLGRRVSEDGRTRAYLNGRTSTVSDLREIGAALIAFYGQHEHRRLTVSSAQLRILDDFCGARQAGRRADCAAALRELRAAEAELGRLREISAARERELGLIEYELGEIEQVDPQAGEHERLLAERERQRGADALRLAAGQGAAALGGEEGAHPGAGQLIAAASAKVDALLGVDSRLDALGQRLRALCLEAEDLAAELRSYGDGLDADEGALQEVEERLAALERLMRKHGGSVESVLAHAQQISARRDELLGAEVAAEQAQRRRELAGAALQEAAQALRAARRKAAPRLAAAVREQLASLAMPEASFEVSIAEREVSGDGADAVELMLAPNPGVRPGPLREIASGGELSRAMLALLSVANASEPHLSLVFDEIDAGIGGHTARAVGERLRELAQGRQVICITHLPQIASLAARHFTVVKDTSGRPTRALVAQLREGEVVGELVRMLGAGQDDAAARRHAKELRKAA